MLLPRKHRSSRSYHLSHRRFLYSEKNGLTQVTIHEPVSRLREVREAVVQDIWRRQDFASADLTTSSKENIVVVNPGELNSDGGPDFLNAQIEIDDILWMGAVEIHRHSKGWFEHGHHRDPVYNRVVLHVSLLQDERTGDLRREDGTIIPEIILYPHLNNSIRKLLYRFYRRSGKEIYCSAFWKDVPVSIRRQWIRWLGYERLHAQKRRMAEAYLRDPDLEDVLYRNVFRSLGYSKNEESMQMLTDRLPLEVLRAVGGDLDELEALLFGMAGLLAGRPTASAFAGAEQEYIDRLQETFDRMSGSLDRPPMSRSTWRFFRLRPANFPTLRIAQGAALLCEGRLLYGDSIGRLVDAVKSAHPVRALRELLRAAPSGFWRTHIRFDRRTKERERVLGKSRADAVAVNVLLPAVLLHAEQSDDPALARRVEEVFDDFPAREDRIIRKYKEMGTKPKSAVESQGMHQLYRTRCTEAKCLQCAVGRYVMSRL